MKGLSDKLAAMWLKIRMADHLRLMADNQRTLDRTARDEEAFRDLNRRTRESLSQRQVPTMAEPTSQASDDPMEIKIDSPTTTHQHFHAPTAGNAPAPMQNSMASFVRTAAIAAIAGTPLGAAYLWSQRAVKPVAPTTPPPAVVQSPDPVELQYQWRIYRDQDHSESRTPAISTE